VEVGRPADEVGKLLASDVIEFGSYDWPADISEEEALARLLELNRERTAAGR
jgi:hypothetical protein